MTQLFPSTPNILVCVFLSVLILSMLSLGTLTKPISLTCNCLSFNLSIEVSYTFDKSKLPNGSMTVSIPSRILQSLNLTCKLAPMNLSGDKEVGIVVIEVIVRVFK